MNRRDRLPRPIRIPVTALLVAALLVGGTAPAAVQTALAASPVGTVKLVTVATGLSSPVLVTAPKDDSGGRCAVTGGYVYRGSAVASLRGWYVFGDYCSGEVLAVPAGSASRPAPVRLFGTGSGRLISAFGQDQAGELYVCDLRGTVYKIAPA